MDSRTCVFLTAIIAVSIVLALPGCASQSQRPSGASYRIDRSLSPEQNLRRLAELEESDSKLTPRSVDLPPGIEPDALALRGEDDAAARMSYDEAITEFASRSERSRSEGGTEAAGEPVDPAIESTALRHYARGREAALADQHYIAITELHRALELDPNAVAVLRELARSHLALGNTGKSAEFYMRIVEIDPAHEEALFAIALSFAARREWERSATMLAGHYARQSSFQHDPAADAIAQFTLATALRHLGYDRAMADASRIAASASAGGMEQTIYGTRVASLHRQQSELWRSIGDAHCRLGEYADALSAYAIAAVLPSTDPAALHPRVIYANLRLGRIYTAQYEMLSVLRNQGASVSDRDIRLCAYLADHIDEIDLLRQSAIETYQADHDAPELARTTAALLPPAEAASLLREFLQRSPRNVDVAAQLLGWLGSRDLRSAVDLVVTLIEEHPDLAGDYVTRLLFAAPRPMQILERLHALPTSPITMNIESRVLAALGGLGEAWDVMTNARRRWPVDEALLWLQLELTSLLEEPVLLREATSDADWFDSPISWMFRARAHRGLDQSEQAIDAAERARDLAFDEVNDASEDIRNRVLLELAHTYHAYAASRTERPDVQSWANEAANVAESVIKRDLMRESAHELLISIYGPNGMLSDPALFQDAVRRLLESQPESRLYARLAAEELMGQDRYEPALERLMNLYETDPHDVRALALAVESWSRLDRLDEARSWLAGKLRERPGDPALLEQWVKVMLRQERTDEVLAALTDAIEAQPEHFAAIRLLESAYRAAGEREKAFPLGEARLLSMPNGARRDIELAALYGGVGMERKSLELLETVLENANDATFNHLVTATAVLERLEEFGSDTQRREQLILGFATDITERFPNTPLQIYGLGLRAMARLGRMDFSFEEFALRAVRRMPRGSGTQVAMYWREMAQALVSAGEPIAAARAIRPLIHATELHEPPASDLLAAIAIAADAASGEENDRSAQTIQLVEFLDELGRLPALPGADADGPPTAVTILYAASQMYSVLGNDIGVDALLVKALDIQPDDAMTMNNLGYMRIEAGIDDRATIELIERAHELEPNEPHILDTIGWLRYRQGVWDDSMFEIDENGNERPITGAAELLELALAGSDESSAEVLDHLGDTYWRLDRRSDAVSAWQNAERILSDPTRKQQIVQNLHLLQTRGWGLLVADAEQLYDATFGQALEAVRNKLAAAANGQRPPITPTFYESKKAQEKAYEEARGK